jgi:hypothetical protein
VRAALGAKGSWGHFPELRCFGRLEVFCAAVVRLWCAVWSSPIAQARSQPEDFGGVPYPPRPTQRAALREDSWSAGRSAKVSGALTASAQSARRGAAIQHRRCTGPRIAPVQGVVGMAIGGSASNARPEGDIRSAPNGVAAGNADVTQSVQSPSRFRTVPVGGSSDGDPAGGCLFIWH